MEAEVKKNRILFFPKWVMHRRPFYPLAFSSVRFTVLGMAALLGLTELIIGAMYVMSNGFAPFWILTGVALATVGAFLVFSAALYRFKVIVINRDCFNCQFSFHVIAHETNHIRLNSHDEKKVEEETLKQNRKRFIPMLIRFSIPKLCKYCAFRNKLYQLELERYLQWVV
jgi:hypothetical protein